MEFRKFLNLFAVITFVFTAFNLSSTAQAYKFFAGGRDGWVLHPSEDYNHWAGRNRFLINDTIYFKYKKGEDSVLLVTSEDYSSCNTKNPIKKWDDGDTLFQFDRSGPFYFISGRDGNCQQGQKLIVVVLALRRTTPTPTPIPTPTPASASPPKATLPPSLPPAPEASPPTAVSPTASPTSLAPTTSPQASSSSPPSSTPPPSTSPSPSGSETASPPASNFPVSTLSPPPQNSSGLIEGPPKLWASVAAGLLVMFIAIRG